jgi:hypothetical protein
MLDSKVPHLESKVYVHYSNFCLRSRMSVSFTCTVVLLTYIPAFCMALHEGTGMSADKNNARRPSTPSGELWSPTWIPKFTVEYLSSKRLPVSTFKDAVHLSPNDDYYLVTDSEGNIGNMRFFLPIPEPQVTEPELLQVLMLTLQWFYCVIGF